MAKTILQGIIESCTKTQKICGDFDIAYDYEIFSHDKYIVLKEKNLDTNFYEYHLYGKENSSNKGFICTFPQMKMALRMIARLEAK